MDIRNLAASGLQGPASIHPASSGESEKTSAGAPQNAPATTSQPEDRIELSDVVRGRLPHTRKGREIAFARKALDALPSLSEERMAKIRERMDNGFYARPEVMHKVAGRLADEMQGFPPQPDDLFPPVSDEG